MAAKITNNLPPVKTCHIGRYGVRYGVICHDNSILVHVNIPYLYKMNGMQNLSVCRSMIIDWYYGYSSIFLYSGTRRFMQHHAIRYATAQKQNIVM